MGDVWVGGGELDRAERSAGREMRNGTRKTSTLNRTSERNGPGRCLYFVYRLCPYEIAEIGANKSSQRALSDVESIGDKLGPRVRNISLGANSKI